MARLSPEFRQTLTEDGGFGKFRRRLAALSGADVAFAEPRLTEKGALIRSVDRHGCISKELGRENSDTAVLPPTGRLLNRTHFGWHNTARCRRLLSALPESPKTRAFINGSLVSRSMTCLGILVQPGDWLSVISRPASVPFWISCWGRRGTRLSATWRRSLRPG
jgi:hypothetical protein